MSIKEFVKENKEVIIVSGILVASGIFIGTKLPVGWNRIAKQLSTSAVGIRAFAEEDLSHVVLCIDPQKKGLMPITYFSDSVNSMKLADQLLSAAKKVKGVK